MNTSGVRIEERVIVFIDVHHFSELAGGPLAEYEFLQEMYATLGDLIVGHGGEIIKYLGDSILSIFPGGCEVNAVECGRQMRLAFAEIIRQRGVSEEIVLEVGIGAGRVAVGECGHETHRQRDVFGQEVNRAAVIGHYEGVAVTEQVYARIKDRFDTLRLPDFERRTGEVFKVWAVRE